LHFTKEIFNKLDQLNINIEFVTLHVGAGTFLPVKSEKIDNHKMHSEWGEVSKKVVNKIIECKEKGGKIISVGTTTLRVIESAFDKKDLKLKPFSGYTDIFIKPGYKLLMLVSAFGGYKNLKAAYQHAIDKEYRFFSYGDCCLIMKNDE
jgi:S-adenosylmethionine:tRNA ribosyltransferase-isomerase